MIFRLSLVLGLCVLVLGSNPKPPSYTEDFIASIMADTVQWTVPGNVTNQQFQLYNDYTNKRSLYQVNFVEPTTHLQGIVNILNLFDEKKQYVYINSIKQCSNTALPQEMAQLFSWLPSSQYITTVDVNKNPADQFELVSTKTGEQLDIYALVGGNVPLRETYSSTADKATAIINFEDIQFATPADKYFTVPAFCTNNNTLNHATAMSKTHQVMSVIKGMTAL